MLQQILEGNTDLINPFNKGRPLYFDDTIVIKPVHVRNILKRFLNKSVCVAEIKEWARFICGREEYTVSGGDDDKITDFYEDMYYVIQRLSTPEIDGEINEISVQSYLIELDKYPDDFY